MSEVIKEFQKKILSTHDGIFGKNTLHAGMQFFNLNQYEAAHFFGQCFHETAGWKYFEENLNYSADRLLLIFRHDFDLDHDGSFNPIEREKAQELQYHPEKIANFVYANQNGNGGEKSGDGWKYRGRGAIQLTGKKNYKEFNEYKSISGLDFVKNPDSVAKEYAFDSALFYFTKNDLFHLCKDISDETIMKVTKRVNGGYNGLKERLAMTKWYFKLLTDA